MSIVLRLVILFLGLSLCTWVILLLARKKINERNTIAWMAGMVAVLVLSIRPKWLDVVASWAGVDYPPSLLFLCSFIVLLIVSLYQSMQISQLHAKLKELSQAVALRQPYVDKETTSPNRDKQVDEG